MSRRSPSRISCPISRRVAGSKRYFVEIKPSAAKAIERLASQRIRLRLADRIAGLAGDPRPRRRRLCRSKPRNGHHYAGGDDRGSRGQPPRSHSPLPVRVPADHLRSSVDHDFYRAGACLGCPGLSGRRSFQRYSALVSSPYVNVAATWFCAADPSAASFHCTTKSRQAPSPAFCAKRAFRPTEQRPNCQLRCHDDARMMVARGQVLLVQARKVAHIARQDCP